MTHKGPQPLKIETGLALGEKGKRLLNVLLLLISEAARHGPSSRFAKLKAED